MPEREPSIERDQAALYASASQVETALLCPRRWGYKSIARLQEPEQGTGAAVGDAAHKQLERYLGREAPLDFTEVVHGVRVADVIAPGLGYLPDPIVIRKEWIETKFLFKSEATGIHWTGRKDLELPNSNIIPDLLAATDPGAPCVLDHKTSSNVRWAKTQEQLKWDVQANLYAYELTLRFPDAPHVDLVWQYYQTRGAKRAQRTHLRVLREEAEEGFRRIEHIGAAMQAHKVAAASCADKEAYVKTMRPNPHACQKFGVECPYSHVCALTENERFIANMSDANNFFANLANIAAKEDGVTAIGAPAVVTAPMPVQLTQAPEPTVITNPLAVLGLPSGVAINPPESLLPVPTLPTMAPSVNVMGMSAADVPAADPNVIPAAFLPPVNALAKAAEDLKDFYAEEEEDAKAAPAPSKRRGRPAGSKNASGVVTNNFITYSPEQQGALQVALDAVSEKLATPEGFTLYVDCLPQGVRTTNADDLLYAANIVACAETEPKVAHYSFLPYGKGKGAIEVALEQVLESKIQGGTTPAAIFCRSTSDALGVLTRRATGIVRGVAA